MAKNNEEVVYRLSLYDSEDPAVKRDLEVAQKYLSDNKGKELELSGAQFQNVMSVLENTPENAVITNKDLAQLNAASFATLHDDVKMSTIQIQQEVRAVGNLVAACHADNIAKLNELQKGIQAVNNNVLAIGQNLEVVATGLLELRADFLKYVKKDELVNNMQMAKQQLISLNQQLESEFGHNKELRRSAAGILQANDLGVRVDTITTRAEEMCLSTPNYWLAPALVALSWWISASRDTASGQTANTKDVQVAVASLESMLREAYTREASKTALFFGLICRRSGNIPQANEWFREYLAFQNPREVDQTCIVLLNLYASGLMGHGVEEQGVLSTLSGWLDELMEADGGAYQAQLIDDWKKTCRMLYELAEPSPEPYAALPAFSPTWPALQTSMQESLLHEQLNTFLDTELSRKDFAEDDVTILDGLITDLVSDYDADELPIRREQEYQQLILDLKGNEDLAKVLRAVKDDILSETKSFVSIISDAARNAELSGASSATAVYALRLQMPWVKRAYLEVAEQNRAQTPQEIELQLDGFHATTVDGSNEEEVIEAYVNYENQKEKSLLEQSKTGTKEKVALIGGAAVAVIGLLVTIVSSIAKAPFFAMGLVALVIGGALAGYGWWAAQAAKKKQEEIRQKMRQERPNGVLVIRRFMEEVRTWRATYALHEDVAPLLMERIDSETANLMDGVASVSEVRS